MSIQQYLDKIKNAVYGREVRGAIHDAIKQTYDDASEGGDANMEVKMARGTFPNLNARLDNQDDKIRANSSQLAEKANQSEVDRLGDIKADKAYVENLFTNLDGLEIKGGFDTLVDLENAYPNGTLGLYVVDDYLYGWNGNEWKVVKELEVMPWADFLTEQDEEWVV